MDHERCARSPWPNTKATPSSSIPSSSTPTSGSSIAKDAGMKYIVITSKHHDGFAMFRRRPSNYNIVDATPFKRDPLEELAEACAEAGHPARLLLLALLGLARAGRAGLHQRLGQGPMDKRDPDEYFQQKSPAAGRGTSHQLQAGAVLVRRAGPDARTQPGVLERDPPALPGQHHQQPPRRRSGRNDTPEQFIPPPVSPAATGKPA